MSKKQMGFTLIEIVMVLVLLGILAAVAVPKYFDLRDQAEEKAALAMGAEYQARLNGKFAEELLAGENCSAARTSALDEANTMNNDNYDNFTIGTITYVSGTNLYDLTITGKNGSTKAYTAKISVPTCAGETTTRTP